MAEPLGLFDRMRAALGRPAPIRQASPEETDAPPTIGGMVSQSPESFMLAHLGAFMKGLIANDDTILRREGSQSLKLYDAILDDEAVMSSLQQRRLAITSKDWEVAAGDDDDPRSVKAGEDFRAMLKSVGFDRVTNLLHFSIWYGHGVGEGIFVTKQHDGRLIIWLDDIVVPDRKWFGFTHEGELRFVAAIAAIGGEIVPPNKFLTIRTGATHDFAFYGLGLAHWVYWSVWFKRAALKYWALYLEKLAQPTAIGEFDEAAGPDSKKKMLEALAAIGRDSAVVVPKGTKDSIQLLEATRSGSGVSSYKDFVTEQNESIMRVILGQPGTSKATAGGIGSTQADVHADVKAEIIKADADLICEAINRTLAVWLTRWNHGEDVAPPTVFRVLDDAETMDDIADRDVKLDGIGIKRKDDSIAEVYGESYERVEEPDPIVVPPGADGNVVPIGAARKARQFEAHDPEPLYVRRDLKASSAKALVAWAKKAGFATVVDPAEMHVTVLYSKTPVDWFDMGTDDWGGDAGMTVAEGGPRKVERLGKDGAIVLHFASDRLRWRHDDMVRRGGSHDFPEFLAHVTISYDPGDVDLAAIEAFTGTLEFGPEIFEAIKPDHDPAMLQFDAGELDAMERLVEALVADTNPVFAAMADELRSNLEGVTTLEGARVAMLDAFERLPLERLAKLTALPMLAQRAASEAGLEERIVA